MIRLNLLPEIKREYLKARRIQARVISIAIIVCIASVGAVALAGFWVYAVQNIHKATLTDSIKKKSEELKEVKDIDKYVTVQSQLANISDLHTDKVIMSRIFEVMSRLNPKAPNNVRITSLEVDTEASTMLISGETDSFTGLETFRDTLKNASLVYTPSGQETTNTEQLFVQESVAVLNQGLGKTSDAGRDVVVFKLSVEYNPVLLVRDSQNIAVLVPNKETTQSKQDSPNVFSEGEATSGGNE